MGHYKIVLPSLFFIAKSVYTILHQNIDTGTKPFSTIFLRPLRILEKWKMREIHVFFMYFAYQILNQVKKNHGEVCRTARCYPQSYGCIASHQGFLVEGIYTNARPCPCC